MISKTWLVLELHRLKGGSSFETLFDKTEKWEKGEKELEKAVA